MDKPMPSIDALSPEDRVAYRMEKYRPVVEFLLHHMNHDAEKLKTVMEFDERWFDDTACALTLDEMLVLYERGKHDQ
jgi:hypothetical protein